VLKGSAEQSCHISELWQRRGAARGLTHTHTHKQSALAAQCSARGLSLTHTHTHRERESGFLSEAGEQEGERNERGLEKQAAVD